MSISLGKMGDDFIFPAESSDKKHPSTFKKVLIVLGSLLGILTVAITSYFLGVRSKTAEIVPPAAVTGESTQITPTQTSSPIPTLSAVGSASATAIPKKATSSPTPTPTLITKSKILSSIAVLDGFRSSNGDGDATLEIRAGRNNSLATRGFATFDLSPIPQAAKVLTATLRLYQTKITGNPYSKAGFLKLDHLTYGDSLDDSDYAMAALFSSFTTLSQDKSLGWKEADVTDAVRDDLANARTYSQFRIHFSIETKGADATGDFVYFEAAENNMGTGKTPQLVVNYY